MQTTVRELLLQGYTCSQIMVLMTMNRLGLEDSELVKAVNGLAGGMGIQHACGIVTGAACACSLASPEQGAKELFPAFYERFYQAFCSEHGSILCIDLLDGDPEGYKQRCPGMIEQAWDILESVLKENGL